VHGIHTTPPLPGQPDGRQGTRGGASTRHDKQKQTPGKAKAKAAKGWVASAPAPGGLAAAQLRKPSGRDKPPTRPPCRPSSPIVLYAPLSVVHASERRMSHVSGLPPLSVPVSAAAGRGEARATSAVDEATTQHPRHGGCQRGPSHRTRGQARTRMGL
jgi:hypothetical protein